MAKKLTIEEILVRLTDPEKEKLAAALQSRPLEHREVKLAVPTGRIRLGYMADTHIGHEKFSEELFLMAMKTFEQEGIETIFHAGDVLEGMSGRDGHIYELRQIGFEQQSEYAIQLFSEFPWAKWYAIDGNHTCWYTQKANQGISVGKELQRRLPNYNYLGAMEGDIEFNGIVRIKLYHANDGTAYASSYKIQKLIESFTGGDKPNIVLSGHYHKHLTLWTRNVFGVECGTLCDQTEFMRGKKLAAHMGFGFMTISHDDKGLTRIDHTFVPYFPK